MSTMNEATALTMIEAATANIEKLNAKRGAIASRMAEIDKLRGANSYAAHVEDDPAAKKLIASLASEVVRLDADAASLDAALAEAATRLERAQAAERQAESKKTAREAQANYKWLVQHGREMSEHAVALSLLMEEAKKRIDRNHALGYAFPTSMQWISTMTRATSAMIMTFPLKNFEHSFLPPGQRFDYGKVLADWGNTGLRTIDQAFSNLNGSNGSEHKEREHHVG